MGHCTHSVNSAVISALATRLKQQVAAAAEEQKKHLRATEPEKLGYLWQGHT